ncbi:MAG: prepilin peptidase [Candidatus Micrarchaeia archaeon]
MVFEFKALFEPVLVALCIALGVLTSREDLKKGVISNRVVFSFIAFAAIAHFPLVFEDSFSHAYLFAVFENFLIALLAGIVLWELKVFSAGDAKLFAAFAALVPLSFYQSGFLPFFPSFALLVNTFVPATVFFMVYLLWKTDYAEKKQVFARSFKAVELIQVFLMALWISWIFQAFYAFSPVAFAGGGLGLVALPVFFALKRFMKPRVLITISIAVILLQVFLSVVFEEVFPAFSLTFLFVAFLAAFIMFALSFFSNIANFWFNAIVRVSDLRAGMLPLENAFRLKNGKIVRKKLERKPKGAVALLQLPKGILSKKDVALLKKLLAEKKLDFDGIAVRQTTAFAPLLFAGVLTTLLIQGNILFLLLKLFS